MKKKELLDTLDRLITNQLKILDIIDQIDDRFNIIERKIFNKPHGLVLFD